jgi:hypothetical protein
MQCLARLISNKGKIGENEKDWGKMEDYQMSTLEEYFDILDKENRERSKLIAQSLVKYLQKTKETKYDSLKKAENE